jgi:hypothetical protein
MLYGKGHGRGTVMAPFLANIAPENSLYTKGLPEKGAYGAMFFTFSVYEHKKAGTSC